MFQAFLIAIRILLGAVFLFSAISKLFPIEIFELHFLYHNIGSWTTAPYLSRFLIGLELFIGLGLILKLPKQKFFLITSAILLFSFSLFLLYSIRKFGNRGNCGCFGSVLSMTPLESIIKNIILFLATALLLWKEKASAWLNKRWLIPSIFLISFVIVFVLFPVKAYDIQTEENPVVKGEAAFSNITGFVKDENVNFKQGEYIVAFLSISCAHCKEIAFKIGIVDKDHNIPPVYFVLWGDKDDVQSFFDDTNTDYPYKLVDIHDFFNYSGMNFPKVSHIKDGIIQKEWNYKTFNALELEAIEEK